ncbi:MAG: DUF4340 domain-containing protein [Gammaproteobacteria bacterium]|nr:DUF4340 domain-containing protein [Gammaproteobacteria bacterium]
MRAGKGFYVLVGVTIAMVAAAVMVHRSPDDSMSSHGLHVPDLAHRADAVHTVLIRTADAELRLERTDEGWVARSKTGYPADAERIRQLVLGVSQLERLERKTANPDRLGRLDLRDIDVAGSRAVRVSLLTADGTTLADVLVGKTHDFQQEARSRYFVRDAGDSQSWLVEGWLPPVLEELSSWLERRLMPGIGESALASVTVTHTDGETVTIRREGGEVKDFRLSGLSGGETIDSQYKVNAIAETLRRLSLKDVRDAGAALGETIARIEAVTFNGVRIIARIGTGEPDYPVGLEARYEGETDTERGEQLASTLDDRWRGRWFVVSQYALDDVLVRREDLVKQAAASTEAE